MSEAQELLTEVNAALKALISGRHQSYSVNGRTVMRHQIGELRELRKDLMAEIARTSGAASVRVAKITKPRI